MYEKSYMHQDVLTHVLVTSSDYVVTGSQDGHLKFWKKMPQGIEFVKHFRAHLTAIMDVAVTVDGLYLATVGADRGLKLFDVIAFDMVKMIELPYTPRCCAWIYRPGETERTVLAVSDAESNAVYLYDALGSEVSAEPLYTVSVHSAPVRTLAYNPAYDCCVSSDERGLIEYWSARAPFDLPADRLQFRYKSETDLYEFAKCQTSAHSLELSRDGEQFACVGRDRCVRVFRFASGRMSLKIDESLAVQHRQQKESANKLDSLDFGRRMANEKDLDKRFVAQDAALPPSKPDPDNRARLAPPPNAVFDESGHFLLYATLTGIKLVNLITRRVIRTLGRVEHGERFLRLALYQGRCVGDAALPGELQMNAEPDPTLFCVAFKKSRFYMFTRREPADPSDGGPGRDVFNERPPAAARAKALAQHSEVHSQVTLHTTLGDIHLKLFTKETPKTCENFITHCKNGYYNGLLFHRVIRNFMIQTGDPRGDGTGGESIWGHDFEDEFVKSLRHDRAGTLSMANAGPNTNGSQFFITTQPADNLDGKHTVFGRVFKGMETVKNIEKVPTDKTDKPRTDVKILNVTVK